MIKNKLTLAEINRLKTTEKVTNALELLKKSKTPFTVEDVAKKAGVGRRTLYYRKDLLVLIKEIQEIKQIKFGNKQEYVKKGPSVQEIRITKLRDENKRLKHEQTLLLEQNAKLTEQIIRLEQRQYELEESIQHMRQKQLIPLNSKK